MLSRIANFDDFDPLREESDVTLTMVPPWTALPGDADLIILPGTKATIPDLAFLREQGWDVDLAAHLRRGGHVLGICGGAFCRRAEHDSGGLVLRSSAGPTINQCSTSPPGRTTPSRSA